MSIGWIMGAFFAFVTFVFIAICFFLPEWVGITGKKARRTIQEHQEGSKTEETPENDPLNH
ncbi:hypothetical protein EHQ82_01720 [Leptospira selangorensis]|uniref:Uncharacterized protein n=2 Tax=Leptospira selangorensis TaxID=2484982 RepID=A0ABY2NHM1_9LEPT|nr:hypothetical protein EHQ82_01720 [Leptospira selangorensis]